MRHHDITKLIQIKDTQLKLMQLNKKGITSPFLSQENVKLRPVHSVKLRPLVFMTTTHERLNTPL